MELLMRKKVFSMSCAEQTFCIEILIFVLLLSV